MPNDLNRQEDTEQDGVFKRNDQAEEELKKLIVNYESSASATKPNEAENKVAGRIYSFKKTKINN